jgi:UDP-glucuronate 4-epimerase
VKIVVTGAAGFIGSHTSEALVARGHEVVGVDSFDGYLYSSALKRANAAELAETLDPGRFRVVEADICDADAMNRVIGGGPAPDVVCHLAALAGVRPSIAEPLRYARTNVEGTMAVLEACRGRGVERMVFASSSSVYGVRATGQEDMARVPAFREDDPCLTPASPYAATKRAGELVASTYRDLFGLGTSCLRFFTVYGPRQRPDMAIRKFFTAIDEGRLITLFGDGTTRRDYTFVDDIVAGTVAAVERIQPDSFNIYNLGGTATTSLAELVAAIEAVVGKKAVVDPQPLQPGDVPVTYADITNSRRDLDYAPTTPLGKGLEKFWDWYQAQKV